MKSIKEFPVIGGAIGLGVTILTTYIGDRVSNAVWVKQILVLLFFLALFYSLFLVLQMVSSAKKRWLKPLVSTIVILALLCVFSLLISEEVTMDADAVMMPAISKELDHALCEERHCQIYPNKIIKDKKKRHHNIIKMEGMSEVGLDTRTSQIHIILDFRWKRERPITRAFKGRAYYIGRYRVDQNKNVGISKLALKEYSFAPFSGVFAYLFGWVESPFLMRDATTLIGENIRKILTNSSEMKQFAENCPRT